MKIFRNLFVLLSTLIASPVFASESDPFDEADMSSVTPPRLSELFSAYGPIERVFAIIFPLAGLVCLIFIIIGGYMWMSAAGDPARIKTAQNTLTWAIIGLVIILLTVAIIEVIIKFIS